MSGEPIRFAVDPIVEHPSGPWCHLVPSSFCPRGLEALHQFAESLGLPRRAYQPRSSPHYDLRPHHRQRAVELGAVDLPNWKDIVPWLQAARQAAARQVGEEQS